MTERVENIIKREIEFMFGRRIVSSGDCIQLSEEIYGITKSRLNANTLRRFFGLVRTIYAPSASTLKILCTYCGFSSIEDVQHYKEALHSETDSPEQKSLLNYLVNLFRETPVENERNETFKSVVKQTIVFLLQHPDLVDKFQSMIAKTKNGQDYYFEGFSQIDNLNSYYGNGLRYFLKEKTEPQAQILGHSLLVFRYWLTEDEPNMEHHFQELSNFEHLPSFSSNASGRYFASLLYYAEAKGYASSKAITSIQNYYNNLHVCDTASQIDFEMIIAEALILTDNLEEGLYYVDTALKKVQDISINDKSIVQNLYLLKACAMVKTGDSKSAELFYLRIRPTLFDFLKKKMQTILYGFLTETLKRNVGTVDNQSVALINETGFSNLKKFIGIKDTLEKFIDSG